MSNGSLLRLEVIEVTLKKHSKILSHAHALMQSSLKTLISIIMNPEYSWK